MAGPQIHHETQLEYVDGKDGGGGGVAVNYAARHPVMPRYHLT